MAENDVAERPVKKVTREEMMEVVSQERQLSHRK